MRVAGLVRCDWSKCCLAGDDALRSTADEVWLKQSFGPVELAGLGWESGALRRELPTSARPAGANGVHYR